MGSPWGGVKAVVAGTFLLLATLLLASVQLVIMRIAPRHDHRLPQLWHRAILFAVGLKVRCVGTRVGEGPAMLVANHTSYLDIPIIGALGRLAFIAKSEVGDWPGIGFLSTLQRTIFVERGRRSRTLDQQQAIASRLKGDEVLVLFAEGTSSDGNRVLPFKSALLSVAEAAHMPDADVLIQPVSIAYTHRFGLPMQREERPAYAWYGDMDLAPHLAELLREGPISVTLVFHEPVRRQDFPSRKALTNHCQRASAQGVAEALAGRPVTPLRAPARFGVAPEAAADVPRELAGGGVQRAAVG